MIVDGSDDADAYVNGNRNLTAYEIIMQMTRVYPVYHYDDVIMDAIASQMTSLASVYSDAHIKENIKAPRHWPLCREFTGDRWIPRTNGQ